MVRMRTKRITRILLICACVFLGVLFIFSGASKILWSHAFERALKMYRLGLSELTEKSVRVLLPLVEIGLGVLLVSNRLRDFAFYSTIIVLTIFTTAQLWVIAHGWNVPCGCFGSHIEETIGAATVSRNAVFIAVAIAGVLLNDKYRKQVSL